MKMNRRQFLTRGLALLTALSTANGWPDLAKAANTLPLTKPVLGSGAGSDPVLVIVQLDGGNDGINTLIPYGQGAYFDARPTLAYKEKDVLPLTGGIGFHPSFKQMKTIYDAGHLAIVQGVGYPQPNRSHFRSQDIWQTAVPEVIKSTGWIGKYMETALSKDVNPLKALEIGRNPSKIFKTANLSAPILQAVETYHWLNPNTPDEQKNRMARAFQRMYGLDLNNTKISVATQRGADAYASVDAIHSLVSGYRNVVQYPTHTFGKDMQLIAKLLASKSGTRVFFAKLGGFDDHADERIQHADLLKEYDDTIGAFFTDLKQHGLDRNVVVLTYSEFGRRVKENGSKGTDHGAAAPVFVLGSRVRGGFYGEYPSLTKLDNNGDLIYNVDFRSIYASLLEGWLSADARAVLGKNYEQLKLFL